MSFKIPRPPHQYNRRNTTFVPYGRPLTTRVSSVQRERQPRANGVRNYTSFEIANMKDHQRLGPLRQQDFRNKILYNANKENVRPESEPPTKAPPAMNAKPGMGLSRVTKSGLNIHSVPKNRFYQSMESVERKLNRFYTQVQSINVSENYEIEGKSIEEIFNI